MRERPSGVTANWGDAYQTPTYAPTKASGSIERPIGFSVAASRIVICASASPRLVDAAGCDEDDELRPVLREGHARGDSADGRLDQLLTRSRVDEANEVAAADRERSPVGAIRKARLAGVRSRQRVPDLGVGSRVEEENSAAAREHRQRLPVGTDGESSEHVAVTVHDPDGSRAAPKCGEQVAAGLRRVVDRDRLAGEQKREVEVLLDERLGAEALDELGRLRVSGLAALDDGEDPARDGGGEQDGDADEQTAQAAVGAPDAFRLLLGCLAALGDELALELVDVERVIGGPVEGGGEAGAAVELALIASCRVPFGRCLGDVTAKPAPFGVLFDPRRAGGAIRAAVPRGRPRRFLPTR